MIVLLLASCGVDEPVEPACEFPFVEENYRYEDVHEPICILATHGEDTIMSGKWHLLGYKYLKDSLEHCQENFFIDYCNFENQCDYCN